MRIWDLSQRFGVTRFTIANWTAHKGLGFPQPIMILNRKYWKRSEIDAWEASRPRQDETEAAVA